MRDAYTVDNGDESGAMKFLSIYSPPPLDPDVDIETINADHLKERARFQFSWDQWNVGSLHMWDPVAIYTVNMKPLLVHRVKVDGPKLNLGLAYRYDQFRDWTKYEEKGEIKVIFC